MCLILFSFNVHPEYSLILAGNRDEFYNRPTAPLGFWEDTPSILGGRDLLGGGSWLGVSRNLRIAAITNYRNPSGLNPDAPSRGNLVKNFLRGSKGPRAYAKELEKTGGLYNGFNLITGQKDCMWLYSNHGGGAKKILPGFYGISNHLMDTPWPKIKKSKTALKGMFTKDEFDAETLFAILEDKTFPPVEDLPDTGVGEEWERIFSPIFVSSDIYGTRSSSIVLIRKDGSLRFLERAFLYQKDGSFDIKTREFQL